MTILDPLGGSGGLIGRIKVGINYTLPHVKCFSCGPLGFRKVEF